VIFCRKTNLVGTFGIREGKNLKINSYVLYLPNGPKKQKKKQEKTGIFTKPVFNNIECPISDC